MHNQEMINRKKIFYSQQLYYMIVCHISCSPTKMNLVFKLNYNCQNKCTQIDIWVKIYHIKNVSDPHVFLQINHISLIFKLLHDFKWTIFSWLKLIVDSSRATLLVYENHNLSSFFQGLGSMTLINYLFEFNICFLLCFVSSLPEQIVHLVLIEILVAWLLTIGFSN